MNFKMMSVQQENNAHLKSLCYGTCHPPLQGCTSFKVGLLLATSGNTSAIWLLAQRCQNKNNKEKTNEEGSGMNEHGGFKTHPGAMWEGYEPPFASRQGCVCAEDICEPVLLIHHHIYATAAQRQAHVK